MIPEDIGKRTVTGSNVASTIPPSQTDGGFMYTVLAFVGAQRGWETVHSASLKALMNEPSIWSPVEIQEGKESVDKSCWTGWQDVCEGANEKGWFQAQASVLGKIRPLPPCRLAAQELCRIQPPLRLQMLADKSSMPRVWEFLALCTLSKAPNNSANPGATLPRAVRIAKPQKHLQLWPGCTGSSLYDSSAAWHMLLGWGIELPVLPPPPPDNNNQPERSPSPSPPLSPTRVSPAPTEPRTFCERCGKVWDGKYWRRGNLGYGFRCGGCGVRWQKQDLSKRKAGGGGGPKPAKVSAPRKYKQQVKAASPVLLASQEDPLSNLRMLAGVASLLPLLPVDEDEGTDLHAALALRDFVREHQAPPSVLAAAAAHLQGVRDVIRKEKDEDEYEDVPSDEEEEEEEESEGEGEELFGEDEELPSEEELPTPFDLEFLDDRAEDDDEDEDENEDEDK
ncbi:hypothetical protein DFJ77DRAFT_440625 [Powellomyces hirtus]|nr:hypothetical protein DFJ77DRAFT_440625 [Powellomyces hirtus]